VILVADDEKAMRDSCALVLEREGFEVVTADEGKAALETLGHRLPDVIIVDLKMPGMSGEEFLTLAKEIDPNLVAIAITGYATLGSAVEAMKAGAYDFLPKPFRAEELRLIVRRALEKRRLSLIAAEAEREKRCMRDHFVAVVSHQLKSPAASLKECLDAVLAGHETAMPVQ
jgi:DNA-binding NtrC family response regulator